MDHGEARLRRPQERHQRPPRRLEQRQEFGVAGAVDGRRPHDGQPLGRNHPGGRVFAGPLAGGVGGQRRFARGEAGDEDQAGRARGLGDARGPSRLTVMKPSAPTALVAAGQVQHHLGALGQPAQRRGVGQVAQHEFRMQAAPEGRGGVAADQGADPEALRRQGRDQVAAEEAGGRR